MRTHTHPTRAELVQRWRDIVQQLELAPVGTRGGLTEQLRHVESQAVALLIREQDDEVRQ